MAWPHVRGVDGRSQSLKNRSHHRLTAGCCKLRTDPNLPPRTITAADAAGIGDRPLQILQLEESTRFRSNLGLVEMTGNPMVVEVSAVVPNSKVALTREYALKANEFRQITRVLAELGLGNAYNARISVKAKSGSGRVGAYGSVVDNSTQDPTYVPAQ